MGGNRESSSLLSQIERFVRSYKKKKKQIHGDLVEARRRKVGISATANGACARRIEGVAWVARVLARDKGGTVAVEASRLHLVSARVARRRNGGGTSGDCDLEAMRQGWPELGVVEATRRSKL
jgi:hypothetical protein